METAVALRRVHLIFLEGFDLQLIKAELEEEGFEVDVSDNLRAYEAMKAKLPSVVVMSLENRHLDGIDQVKIMQLDPVLKDVPVILVCLTSTGYERAIMMVTHTQAPIVDIMRAPIETGGLVRGVERAILDAQGS